MRSAFRGGVRGARGAMMTLAEALVVERLGWDCEDVRCLLDPGAAPGFSLLSREAQHVSRRVATRLLWRVLLEWLLRAGLLFVGVITALCVAVGALGVLSASWLPRYWHLVSLVGLWLGELGRAAASEFVIPLLFGAAVWVVLWRSVVRLTLVQEALLVRKVEPQLIRRWWL